MISSTRRATLAVVMLAATLALSACSGGNKGGATTCGEYGSMSAGEQEVVIRTFLESKGNSDPAGIDVTISQTSAQLYCATVGLESDPISKIDG